MKYSTIILSLGVASAMRSDPIWGDTLESGIDTASYSADTPKAYQEEKKKSNVNEAAILAENKRLKAAEAEKKKEDNEKKQE